MPERHTRPGAHHQPLQPRHAAIRYEIGDIAEMGEGCDCGTNLPVISRILGRERSFIQLPDGSLRLARLTGEHWRQHAPIREYRVVQYKDGIVEAIIVPERPLSAQETANLKSMLAETLGHPFPIVITETEAIHWQSRWKRHDVMRLNRDYGGRSENTPLPSPAPARGDNGNRRSRLSGASRKPPRLPPRLSSSGASDGPPPLAGPRQKPGRSAPRA